MATADNKYGDIGSVKGLEIINDMLKRMEHGRVLQKYSQREQMQKNSSRVAKWKRWRSIPITAVALAEGNSGEGAELRGDEFTATLEFIGRWVSFTQEAEELLEVKVAEVANDVLTENANDTIETMLIKHLSGHTMRWFAGGVQNRAEIDMPVQGADLSGIVQVLDQNRAKEIDTMIPGTTRVGTKPVPAAFRGVCHPAHEWDFRQLKDFTHKANYSNPGDAGEHEFGTTHRIRWEKTTLIEPWIKAGKITTTLRSDGGDPLRLSDAGERCDVYPLFIFGKNAFSTVQLAGYDSFQIIVNKRRGQHGDELARKGTIGWGTYFAASITGPQWLVVYEAGITANPTS